MRNRAELVDAGRIVFRGWLEEYAGARHEIEVRPEDRWIASSAWQKAIRRGRSEYASAVVRGLWRLDPAYVRRRLPVILLEDIAWADPDLMLVGMLAPGRSGWWRDRGADAMAMHTERASTSAKDRSTVDLVVAVDRQSERDSVVRSLLRETSVGQRITVASDTTRTPFERMAALWALGGTAKYQAEHAMCLSPATPDDLARAIDLIAEDRSAGAEAWLVGRGRTRDAMPLAAILTDTYRSADDVISDESARIPDDPWIGAYPSSSFDRFTRLGHAAIAAFIDASEPWRRWLRPARLGRRAAQHTTERFLFRVESGLLDRRLVMSVTGAIAAAPLQAAARIVGIPLVAVDEGKALLVDQLPLLHEIRARVARGAGHDDGR
jgi:hypothetical protein